MLNKYKKFLHNYVLSPADKKEDIGIQDSGGNRNFEKRTGYKKSVKDFSKEDIAYCKLQF